MRFFCCLLSFGLLASSISASDQNAEMVIRGEEAVRGKPTMNPSIWTVNAYQNVWKQWGLKEKPDDFEARFRDRYGLHVAPYENNGLPMGLHYSAGIFGKGVINDCLICHAGRIAGQTITGLGNAAIDLQGLNDELGASLPFKIPIRFGHVRGTIDPVTPVAYLVGFRDPDLNVRGHTKLDYFDHICSDPPAWWLLKKKKTRDWTGGVDARAKRIDMVNILAPFNSAAVVKKHATTFEDIHEFVLSTPSPKYPFSIDHELAKQGAKIYTESCVRCHGTHGPEASYPNKIVPVKNIGTDPLLALSMSSKNLETLNNTWLTQDKGPDDKAFQVLDTGGYQAPPLDGIWATAPYLHNASVPTIYHVLNSKARPKIFTRSYGTEKEDYDSIKLGWKITELEATPRTGLPAIERRRIYDTTIPGQSNTGHDYGDELSEESRRALIEYLKTL